MRMYNQVLSGPILKDSVLEYDGSLYYRPRENQIGDDIQDAMAGGFKVFQESDVISCTTIYCGSDLPISGEAYYKRKVKPNGQHGTGKENPVA